jgi:hypothetical protein
VFFRRHEQQGIGSDAIPNDGVVDQGFFTARLEVDYTAVISKVNFQNWFKRPLGRLSMPAKSTFLAIPLPRAWLSRIRSAILHAIALAQFALVRARSWASESLNPRFRQLAELDQAKQEIALLNEHIRMLNARMESILPQRWPYYPPAERMAILELKAARGWSLEQTAKAFLVTPATIAWM